MKIIFFTKYSILTNSNLEYYYSYIDYLLTKVEKKYIFITLNFKIITLNNMLYIIN